jgi:hypothetical protein
MDLPFADLFRHRHRHRDPLLLAQFQSRLKELHRVVRPNGALTLIAESYQREHGRGEAMVMRALGGRSYTPRNTKPP